MTETSPGWHPAPDRPGQLRYWDGGGWTDNYAPAAPAAARILSDQATNPTMVIIAWVIAVLSVGYMLPWAIAETRGKSNSLAVGLVDFLLGWTIIGWIVALVMACGSHQRFSA